KKKMAETAPEVVNTDVSSQAETPMAIKETEPSQAEMPDTDAFIVESNNVSDLTESENQALKELKQLIQHALNNGDFAPHQSLAKQEPLEQPDNAEEETMSETKEVESMDLAEDDGAKTVEAIEETIVAVSFSAETSTKAEIDGSCKEQVFIWGIPLLQDERSNVVLLKFLRARDFKVKDAFTMLKNTIQWRKEFGIEELYEQNLDDMEGLGKAVFMHGCSREGHPVCYNVYGQFKEKELYHKTFSDEDKRERFLKWRIQFLERSIRKLDFCPGGISTIVQVNDLKDSPGPGKWELRQATKQALHLLQDNYPEFVAKQVFINVPWWYLAVNRMISPFLSQRTKSKFVFASPSKSTETLLKYKAAEKIPVRYGGVCKDGEFSNEEAITELVVMPSAKRTVEFAVPEACVMTWEVRVVGWEVSYGAEFVPDDKDGYTVIIQKAKKITPKEEIVSNSFKLSEPGKIVFTIDNPTPRKKKLLYRYKTKACLD
ncbi:CRAL-TRIO lipid binding domain, partial [Dillenia turbinata]